MYVVSHFKRMHIKFCISDPILYMGIFCCGKILTNVQIKAIGEETFGEQGALGTYAKYIFSESVSIGEEDVDK